MCGTNLIKPKQLMLKNKLKKIKLLLLDVDGVLTDGSVIYNDHNVETKMFNVKDGMGLRLLMDAGILVGIVTGRAADALHHRCKNLGISLIFDGVRDKAAALDQIIKQTNILKSEVAFVGDDLPDIPIMKQAGLSVAVADAHEVVLQHADMVTAARGGSGAVREVCESILKAQGLWDKILDSFDAHSQDQESG
jgi:3-deoxy-D-manno-octulosonate 8-phosphate phosphatase (KDO 8-P phosphatase)